MFASGNMKYWLVVREEIIGTDEGKRYSNSPLTVTASSESDQSYQGKLKWHSIFIISFVYFYIYKKNSIVSSMTRNTSRNDLSRYIISSTVQVYVATTIA